MPTVLLTRPQKESERLAAKLNARGYLTVIEPLLHIETVHEPVPADGSLHAVMITSANALIALMERKAALTELLSIPCFCVGTQTSAAARAFGFSNVLDAAGDGHALAALVAAHFADRRLSLLYIAGRNRDPSAERGLAALGIRVLPWVVYEAVARKQFSERLILKLQNNEIDAILVFSTRTAEILCDLLQEHGLRACCKQLTAIGISEAVTMALQSMPWQQNVASRLPTEDGTMTCLFEMILPPGVE